jgi:hypothetical protein
LGLKVKHFCAAEIHRQIVEVYGEVCKERMECEEMVSFVQSWHGNAQPNAACQYTRITRNGFGGEFFEHPPHSSDIAQVNHYLFLHFKEFLAGQSPRSDLETKDVVQNCLKGFAANKAGPKV